jgi:hypothetical protein
MTKPRANGRPASRPVPGRARPARLLEVEAELAEARRELAELGLRYEILQRMCAWRTAGVDHAPQGAPAASC